MNRDLTLSELSRIVRLHVETCRRLARTGRLPGAYKLVRQLYVCRQVVERLCGMDKEHLAGKQRGSSEMGLWFSAFMAVALGFSLGIAARVLALPDDLFILALPCLSRFLGVLTGFTGAIYLWRHRIEGKR